MLQLPESITHVQAMSHMAWRSDARAAQYQIGLAGIDTFDSSLLALLLDLRRTALAEGKTMTLHNPPAKLMQLATLYGVNELIA